MAFTIDPTAKRIILDSSSVTVKQIYVAWVDWVTLSDNIKHLPAFTSVGGDDLGDNLSVPPYYFLLNGWRIRPAEAPQTLVITGNLFVQGGGDPIVPTLGDFNVLVKSVVPVQAQGITTGGGGSSITAADVWNYLNRTLTSAPSGITAADVWSHSTRTTTGGGLTSEESQKLDELHQLEGLKEGAPLVVNNDTNRRQSGGIVQSVTTVGNVTTVTRL